jgi:phosphate-selective porin OprO/OprP
MVIPYNWRLYEARRRTNILLAWCVLSLALGGASLPDASEAAEPLADNRAAPSSLLLAQASEDADDDPALQPLPPPADVMDQEFSTQPYNMPTPVDADLQNILGRLDALEKASAPKNPDVNADLKKEFDENDGTGKWTDLSGDKWAVKLGGQVQIDSINWANVENPPVPAFNYFEFRRARLAADGVGYGVYDFRLQVEIEPEGEDTVTTPVTVIRDAYLSMNEIPLIDRWRIGNFFVPFSLEQVTNDTNNLFLERSIPTQGIFSADRELGMAVYTVNDAKDFTYTTGIFVDSLSEAIKERIDNNQGQRISNRITYLPYYDEPSNGRYLVHTGGGVLYTHDQDQLARFRARPQIHEGPFLIDTGNFPARSYTTGNIELATVWGPLSVQSEMFLSSVDRINDDEATISGAYVYFSYFLTGENRVYERYGQHGAQFGRIVPFSNFFLVPGGSGPGAWELKGRWSNLTLTELDSGQYNDFTFGLNWYWSDRVRTEFEWIHPVTRFGTTPYGPQTADIIGLRFDFNF